MTVVDCGRVAMSNPLRQSLYTHADCEGGGKHKAQAAVEALTRIHPGVVGRKRGGGGGQGGREGRVGGDIVITLW